MMSAAVSPECTACRAPLKSGALEGLCARCLFGALMSPGEDAPPAPARDRFGDYELLEVIARGGSGVVHRARHVELDRTVALKILPPELSGEEEFVERFRTEAAAAASLEHPNIVPVYDFGAHEGRHFLAMKLIEGSSAAQRMKPQEAAARLITVARAVHHAHQRGVLHRDLKPGNILFDAGGEPFLTDFGLAKLISREATITRTRAVLGTPAYMSPEQAEGKTREITTAADVYGLGAVLYHWLTGSPPFAGGTTLETIRLVMEGSPEPPSRRAPGVDRDLETICLKCLRTEPGARYPSADALAADLERWRRGEPVTARPVRTLERALKWGRRNKVLALVIAGAVLSLLGASLILLQQNRQLAATRSQVSELAEGRRRDLVRLQVETGNRLAAEGDGYAALLPFAEAAALDAGDESRLAMHRFRFAATLAQLPAREQLWRHNGPVFTAGFSNDGTRTITASADGTVGVWNAATGDSVLTPLTHPGPVWWAGFAADDQRIISRTKAGAIYLWDAHLGTPCAGPFPGRGDMPELRDGLAKHIPLSPDGAAFALLTPTAVELRHALDGTLYLTLPTSQTAGSAAWSPDGATVAVVCEAGEALVFDAYTGERKHTLPPHLATGTPDSPVGWRSVTWSPDGTRLSLTDRVFAARLAPPDLSTVSAGLNHQHMVLGTAWNPDGNRLLTWSFDNTLRLWEPAPPRPAASPLRLRSPVLDAAFSPDGRWIAAACRDGAVSLHDSATGERRGPLLRHSSAARDLAWSRDGARLITAGAEGIVQLWKVAGLSGPSAECRHRGSVEQIAVSPGGTYVAAMPLLPEVTVWRMPAGVAAAVLPHGAQVANGAWLSESELMTATSDGTVRTWDVTRSTLLRARTIAIGPHETLVTLRLSPDGRCLAVAYKDRPAEVFLTETGAAIATLGTEPCLNLMWSPCATRISVSRRAGTTFSGTVYTVPPHSQPPMVFPGPASPIAISKGASRAVFQDSGYSARVLDTATGKLTPPMRHESVVLSAAFSADGRILATGTQDGSLRLWDAATAEPLTPPLLHRSWVMCTAAAADGHHFYTGVNGGQLSAWVIPSVARTPAEMKALATGVE